MKQRNTILIVEDEKNISSCISSALKTGPYRTVCASSVDEALCLAASLCPDTILLDLGLPDMDGKKFIENIRIWSKAPIIVISARSGEEEKVDVLDLGADDYMTKPFGTLELKARIRASMRRCPGSLACQSYRTGDLKIDYDKYLVTLGDKEIHLTQIEYKLISLLSQNDGHVLAYAALLESIWGPYSGLDNQILRVNVANIRRKIEPDPSHPRYILTENAIGYRMPENGSP